MYEHLWMNFNTYIILYIYTLIMVYYLTTIVTAASYLTQPLHTVTVHILMPWDPCIYIASIIYVLKFIVRVLIIVSTDHLYACRYIIIVDMCTVPWRVIQTATLDAADGLQDIQTWRRN